MAISVYLTLYQQKIIRDTKLCDRLWVLAEGRNLAVGKPEEIQRNPQVLEAYLGSS